MLWNPLPFADRTIVITFFFFFFSSSSSSPLGHCARSKPRY
jgi:hypothetical protein